MLTLAGATLAYTGCTDYSTDIDDLEKRVDKLETTSAELATVQSQIASLTTLTGELSTASAEAKTAIKALEDGRASEADLTSLTARVKDLESAESAINEAIEALKSGKADASIVTELSASLNSLEKDFLEVKGYTNSLKPLIDAINGNIETLKSNKADVTALENTAKDLQDKIDALNKAVETLESDKADAKDVEALEGRVDGIEDDIDAINENIDSLYKSKADATVVAELEDNVKDLNASVKSINATIEGIDKRVTANETKIAVIEKIIADLQSEKVDSVKAAATYATLTAVAAIEEKLAGLKSDLEVACEKYDKEIADLKDAVKKAQDAADKAQATADAALTTKDLKDIFGVYADKGELEAKIDALVKADSDNADAIKKNYEEYEAFVKDFDNDVNELIAKALESGQAFDLTDLGKRISAIETSVTTLKSEIDAAIAKIWTAINTKIRSLVLISDTYTSGIPVVPYPYIQYTALEFDKSALADVKQSYDGVEYTLPADGGWFYEPAQDPSSNWSVSPAYFHLNPSNATVSEDTKFNVILRNVKTKAGAEYKYVASAEYASCKDGVLGVNIKLGTDDEAAIKPFSPNNEEGQKLFFNLQVIDADNSDATVTSNDGCIDIVINTYESKLVWNVEGNTGDLYPTAAEAVGNAPLTTVDYADTTGVDIKSCLKLQQKLSKTTMSGDFEAQEFADYDFDKNPLGLKYEFSLVKYGVDEVSESGFATVADSTGVLVPCNASGETGNKAISALGRMPLVKVAVKDGADNVLAVGFVKVKITNETLHTVATAQKIAITTDDSGDNQEGKVAISADVYGDLLEGSLADFNKKYALYVGSTESAVLYSPSYTGDDYTKITGFVATDEAAKGISITQTADGELKAVVTAAKCAEIWYRKYEEHKTTEYVRYVLVADKQKNAADVADKDVLYVPVEITVDRQSAVDISGKNTNFWTGDEENPYSTVYLNVATPSSKELLTDTWTTDLDSYWIGNKPSFTKTVNGETADVAGKYKFYFAPIQPKIAGTDIQLVVNSNTLVNYDNWTGDYNDIVISEGAEVYNSNDSIAKLEGQYYLDAKAGLYNNSKIYALPVGEDGQIQGSPDDSNNLIATINQETGEITYATNAWAKTILNHTSSNPNDSCKLYANVGIVMNRVDGEGNDVDVAVNLNKSTIDKYYFLRPINVSAEEDQYFDDKADESIVNIYDCIDITDWRATTTGSFKTAEKAWYFAYYGIRSIQIAENGILTDYLGDDKYTPIKEVSSAFSVKYLDAKGAAMYDDDDSTNSSVDILWKINGSTTPDSDAAIEVTLGTADDENGTLQNAIKNAFGTLVYKNSVRVQKEFNIYVPLEITYAWGTATVTVTIAVKPTN